MTRTLKTIPPQPIQVEIPISGDKGVIGKELLKLYPEYSKLSLYQHAVKSIDSTQVVDKRKFNKGRPKKA